MRRLAAMRTQLCHNVQPHFGLQHLWARRVRRFTFSKYLQPMYSGSSRSHAALSPF